MWLWCVLWAAVGLMASVILRTEKQSPYGCLFGSDYQSEREWDKKHYTPSKKSKKRKNKRKREGRQ